MGNQLQWQQIGLFMALLFLGLPSVYAEGEGFPACKVVPIWGAENDSAAVPAAIKDFVGLRCPSVPGDWSCRFQRTFRNFPGGIASNSAPQPENKSSVCVGRPAIKAGGL